jgi:hypothetical protein
MSDSSPCSYQVLDGGIHEFVLHETSRQAVDIIFDIAVDLLAQDSTRGYPGLIDARVGSLPLDYMLKRVRAVAKQFPKRVQAPVAVLANSGTIVHTALIFLRPIMPVRLYKPAEREQALLWLRTASKSLSKH